MRRPHGYHITFGTYGARLHGSHKPHVDRDHNQYGAPLAPTDPDREQASRERMKQEPVTLTVEQRKCVEESIRELAARYRWPIMRLRRRATTPTSYSPRTGTVLNSVTRSKLRHPGR